MSRLPDNIKEIENVIKTEDGAIANLTVTLHSNYKEQANAFGSEATANIEKQRKEAEALAKTFDQATAKVAALGEAARVKGLNPLDAIANSEDNALKAIDDYEEKYPAKIAFGEEQRTLIVAQAESERLKIYQDEYQKQLDLWDQGLKKFEERTAQIYANDIEDAAKRIKLQEKMRDASLQTQVIEEQAAVALLPPWERTYAGIAASADEAQRRIAEAFGKGQISAYDFARRTAATATEEFAKMRDQLANDLESTFNDITSGQLGARVKKMFEDMVFQIVATWVLGMAGIKQATQGMASGVGGASGGGGGILGGLGGIFGIGGSGAGGITTPPMFPVSFVGGGGTAMSGGAPSVGGASTGSFANSSWTASEAAALGIPIAAGVSLPGTMSKPGAASAAPLAAMLTKLFPHGIKIGSSNISGAQLAVLGVGLGITGVMGLASGTGSTAGNILSAGEAIGGGALTGFAIGGPVGAVIGGIVGGIASLFSWLFGSGKVNKQRDALQAQLQQQLKIIQDSYDLHQTAYGSAISGDEQLRTQFTQAQDQVKKGANMQQYVGNWVDQAEQHINDVEAQRAQASATIANLPLPEFAAGGFTPAYLPGGFMAILHPNEAILNPQGRAAIGDSAITALNRGETTKTAPTSIGPFGITINAAPGMDAQALTQEVIRRLRQLFGDRGLSFGGIMG